MSAVTCPGAGILVVLHHHPGVVPTGTDTVVALCRTHVRHKRTVTSVRPI